MKDVSITTRHHSSRDQLPASRPGRIFGLALLLVLFHFTILPFRIELKADVPLTNRPAEHFYNAEGKAVKATWNIDRNTVPEDGELTATLTVAGASNPQRITRPDLTKLPEFQTRFVITDKKDPAPDERANEVKFSYLLRPRNRSVNQLPMLEFHFYNRAAPDGKTQFPLTIARAVPITVTEAPKLEPPAIPLREPDRLFLLITGPQLLEQRHSITGLLPWLIVGLGGPLCALAWFILWDRAFPNAKRLAKMRQSWAARRALDAIKRAHRTIDPPAAITAGVLIYLRTRFPLSPAAVTPGEIETALTEIGLSAPECVVVAEFFRACDAARFALPNDNGVLLATAAEALISRLEAA